MKTAIKNAESGAASPADLQEAVKKIDKAVAKGIMHKNTAARKKSRLSQKTKLLERLVSTSYKARIIGLRVAPSQFLLGLQYLP